VPYTDEQMFALVADVERYPEFLPWVAALRIKSRDGDTLTADVLAAFGALRERFTSRVTLDRETKTIVAEYIDGPFHHLQNRWHFAAREGGCEIDFDIDFALKSKMLESLIGGLFTRAIEKMTAAFDERARKLYGEATASKHPA
jgi:coenzyme Q-binding protein COQ10